MTYTQSERTERYLAKCAEKDIVQRKVMIPRKHTEELRKLAEKWRKENERR